MLAFAATIRVNGQKHIRICSKTTYLLNLNFTSIPGYAVLYEEVQWPMKPTRMGWEIVGGITMRACVRCS